MQSTHLAAARRLDDFRIFRHFMQRIFTRVVHGSGHRHGCRREGLHLIQVEAAFLEPDRQIEHVFIRAAGMGGNEVRDQVLLLAGFTRVLIKQFLEAVVAAHAGLHHLRQRAFFGMLRRDFQQA